MGNRMKSVLSAIILAGTVAAADLMAPSQSAPGGLAPEVTPQFVTIGFDDNGYSGLPGSGGDGGMNWATDFFRNLENADGTPVRANFYFTSWYVAQTISESPVYVKRSWNQAIVDGHEYGNHTHSHSDGAAFSVSQWENELQISEDWTVKPFDPNESVNSPDASKGAGGSKSEMFGFRAPYLHYNNNLFSALKNKGYIYDCSVEEGWQPEHDGTNYYWPYTMDAGSPGHDYLYSAGIKNYTVGQHPGFWEMGIRPVIVPTDAECANYGIGYSLRDKVKQAISWFDVSTGKLTALDYTLFVEAKMTKAEVLATLKYTLDLRLEGNRAPFLFGAHTDEYSPKYTYAPNATAQERREAIEEFVQYAISKQEVRFTTMKNIINWMKNPTALDGDITIKRTIDASVTPNIVNSGTGCTVADWVNGQVYVGGDSCSYDNKVWRAKWWTNSDTPGNSNVWEDMGNCGGSIDTLYYGTVSPAGKVKVDDGTNKTFTFTADAGYEVTALKIDGNAVTPATSYTFTNVTANHTLEVQFGEAVNPPIYYDITATAGANGAITPLGSVAVAEGTSQTFTFTPDAGYQVDTVLVDGIGVGEPTSYTFNNVTEGHTISVEFEQETVIVPDSFTVTASVDGNGSITPAGATKVEENESIAYAIAATSGYKVDSVLVNGANVGAVTSYNYANVTANGSITAYFSEESVVVPDSFTVTASVDGAGTISPAGASKVEVNESIAYSIAADAGNKLDSVVVNGANVGAVTSYNYSNVTANGSITAYFSEESVVVPDSFTVTASVDGAGTISPAGASKVEVNESIAYSIAADAGNKLDSVVVNGANVGAVTSYNYSNVTANGSITAYFSVESSGGICDGVADWDANESWTNYTAGDRRVNGGKVWEVTLPHYAFYEPSGPYGHYGWKEIGTCQ